MIDIEFSKTQIDFMKKIGISFNFSNISDEDYTPNKDGEMCESIVDMFDV